VAIDSLRNKKNYEKAPRLYRCTGKLTKTSIWEGIKELNDLPAIRVNVMPSICTVTRVETAFVAAYVRVLMIGAPAIVWLVALPMRVTESPFSMFPCGHRSTKKKGE